MFDASGNPVHFTNRRTTDATVAPLTVEEFKAGHNIFHNDDDEFVSACLAAAADVVKARTRRAFTSETHTMTLDRAPVGPILLPVAPVQSVTSLTAYSTADAGSVVATTVYRLDAESVPARLVLKDGQSWPTGLRPQNALVIVYVVGYGTSAAAVTDEGLIHAVRMLAGHWYTNREPVIVGTSAVELPLSVSALIDRLQVPWP